MLEKSARRPTLMQNTSGYSTVGCLLKPFLPVSSLFRLILPFDVFIPLAFSYATKGPKSA